MKFIEWQHSQGGRKTVEDFARYLGIAQSTASLYMNGKRLPEGDILKKLSDKLGLEVYDALDLPRPDEDLFNISALWNELNEHERNAIRKQVETLARRNEEKEKRKHNHTGSKPLPQ